MSKFALENFSLDVCLDVLEHLRLTYNTTHRHLPARVPEIEVALINPRRKATSEFTRSPRERSIPSFIDAIFSTHVHFADNPREFSLEAKEKKRERNRWFIYYSLV